MTAKYSYQGVENKKTVKVSGTNLPISAKTSYEVANAIRGRDVNNALTYLERVTDHKDAVPFKRHNKDTAHRPGKMAAGRFPKKICEHVISLLNTLKKNAENQHIEAEKLRIIHVAAQKGPNVMHQGRMRGKRKITHFEIIAQEMAEKKANKEKKEDKK